MRLTSRVARAFHRYGSSPPRTPHKENGADPGPRVETILARSGLSDAEIAALTAGDPADVRAIIDRDRMSVIDRARAHMAATPPDRLLGTAGGRSPGRDL